jgi:hypothetical protein
MLLFHKKVTPEIYYDLFSTVSTDLLHFAMCIQIHIGFLYCLNHHFLVNFSLFKKENFCIGVPDHLFLFPFLVCDELLLKLQSRCFLVRSFYSADKFKICN